MTKSVGVIGTVIRDTIHSTTGEVIHALGGILYTLLPLRAFLPEEIEIVPMLHVGMDLYDEVMEILGDLPHVSTSHVIPQECENNRVDLYYHNAQDRTELATFGVSPVSPGEMDRIADVDLLIVNFVSGRELSLQAMKRIGDTVPSGVYADLHSLLLGRAEDGRRYPKRPYGWKKWLECFHYVQMNESEAMTLTGVDVRDARAGFLQPLADASERVHRHGPRAVAITLGARGAFLMTMEGDGMKREKWENGVDIRDAVDPTGSGDVFLAAYTSASVCGKGCFEALSFAVHTSALSTATRGAEGLYRYFRCMDFDLLPTFNRIKT
jgi:hypothetical protein